MVFIDRDDELPVTARSDPLPITGRNSQAPFGVQCDFGGPTKHGIIDELVAMRNELAHLLPLFSTFRHYIRAIHQRQPKTELILVVQGLRGYSVAEFGRIVALNWNYKSVT